jgi:hypothetical protein
MNESTLKSVKLLLECLSAIKKEPKMPDYGEFFSARERERGRLHISFEGEIIGSINLLELMLQWKIRPPHRD